MVSAEISWNMPIGTEGHKIYARKIGKYACVKLDFVLRVDFSHIDEFII